MRSSSRFLNRRRFLGEASCAAIGSSSVLSTILNLEMANRAVAAGGVPGTQRKSLVCLYLSGGCDSYNVLIPRDFSAANEAADTNYQEYKAARSNLAISWTSLLQLNGQQHGLHYNLPRLAAMFNGQAYNGDSTFVGKKRLSVVTNVGTLVVPIASKTEYQQATKRLPKALFSHRDQTEQWQTSVPQGMSVLSGWAGRAADLLHSTLNVEQTGGYYMPMNFSLAGNSAFQTGVEEGQFVITRDGALSFTEGNNNTAATNVLRLKNAALKDLVNPLDTHYQNLFQDAFARVTSGSVERGEQFQQEYDAPGTVNGVDVETVLSTAGFNNDNLARNLQSAVRTIAIREKLKLCRQTLFVDYGGWDHHGELLVTQAAMLADLDRNLFAYQKALEMLGIQDDVITFTASDFGRTLRSNGQGTDHAWSGNQFVLGGPVTGGEIHGTFPSLVIDGDDDIGRGGRLFPRLSCDQYFCELLRWFGVSATDMDQVLPNIREFYDPASTVPPVGFLA